MQAANERLVEIIGSYGEGGGQILRTSLALSASFKKPVTIHHTYRAYQGKSKNASPSTSAPEVCGRFGQGRLLLYHPAGHPPPHHESVGPSTVRERPLLSRRVVESMGRVDLCCAYVQANGVFLERKENLDQKDLRQHHRFETKPDQKYRTYLPQKNPRSSGDHC